MHYNPTIDGETIKNAEMQKAAWARTQQDNDGLVGWCFEPSQPQRIISGLVNEGHGDVCTRQGTLKQ